MGSVFFLRACHRHRPHYVTRISEALPVFYASAPCGFSTSPQGFPIRAFPCSSVPLCQRTIAERQSANSPRGDPFAMCWFCSLSESVSPWQGDALLQVSLYVVNLLVGKVRHVIFTELQLNDFGGGIDSLEILIVVVLDKTLRERILVVLQLCDAAP